MATKPGADSLISGPIAIVDCNNFYESCERLFQPKPVVVLSSNDGCSIARGNETKALGIKMSGAYHLRKQEFTPWDVVKLDSDVLR